MNYRLLPRTGLQVSEITFGCMSLGNDQALNCAENGVIAPLVGIIGTCQALEALKLLLDTGESLAGRVIYLDGKYAEWRSLKLQRRPDCPVCGG